MPSADDTAATATEMRTGSAVDTRTTVNLTYPSFEVQCRALTAIYPNFSWCPPISPFHHDTGFLHSTRQQLDNTTLTRKHYSMAADDQLQMGADMGELLGLHEADDELLTVVPHQVTSPLLSLASSEAVWCEWHVVYSAIYRVPVLLFQLTFADGQPLEEDEVTQALVRYTDGRSTSLLMDSAATAEIPPVSCISHPALCRPFHCLHPCQTAQVMALLQQTDSMARSGVKEEDGVLDVLAWLSAVGPFVGLLLSLNTAVQQLIASRISTSS